MSLISFSASRSRFAAWLGLLAILLLFIAPAISKSLAHWRGDSAMMMHHAMGMEMPGMDHAMSDGDHVMSDMQEPASSDKHHPMSMMDDNACGYCVLLAHLQLFVISQPALWSALQAAGVPDVPLFQPITARFIPRFFHPRAPPLSIARLSI